VEQGKGKQADHLRAIEHFLQAHSIASAVYDSQHTVDYIVLELQLIFNYPVPDRSGDGISFSVNFFVYIFVSLLARLRHNGWTDLHDFFREGAEWPWDDLIQFWVNSEKPRNASMLISFSSFVNIMSKRLDRFAWNFKERCEVTMERPDYIFCQFRETARCRNVQHGNGVCCAFAPQLVKEYPTQ